MGIINNPAGAFGYALTESPAGWGQYDFQAGAVVTSGYVVALSANGTVIHALTNVSSHKILGIAIDNAVTNGTLRVANYGPVVAVKGNGNFVAGDAVAVDATTPGVVGALTPATAVTQWKDVGPLVGVVLAAATTGATSVNIFVSRFG